MPIQKPIQCKRGVTFQVVMSLPASESPADYTNWIGSARLRKYEDHSEDGIVSELTFQWAAQTNVGTSEQGLVYRPDGPEFTIKADASDTAEWPVGMAMFDVIWTAGPYVTHGTPGDIRSSATYPVEVRHGVTANG